MPANKKYLTTSIPQKIAKITAGFLGGYMVTMSLHLALAAWLDQVTVIITSTYSAFILWATTMILAFLSKNGLKIWGIYLLLTILFASIAYLSKL